jgi:hypothetical protein
MILRRADVDDFEEERFVRSLEGNTTIEELDLSYNKIGHAEVLNTVYPDLTTAGEALATLLRAEHCSLKKLSLEWNMLHHSLTHLDLSYNALGHDGVSLSAIHYWTIRPSRHFFLQTTISMLQPVLCYTSVLSRIWLCGR